MKPWHSSWWPDHPAACFVLAFVLAILAGAILADRSEATVRAPSTSQVTSRMLEATTTMLDQQGLRVDGVVSVGCQGGTRGDPTRRVRWWCILEQRDLIGSVVWESRVRLRWKRGDVATSVSWSMEGIIRMRRPATGFLTSRRF